jgi:hypothetical protein
MFHFLRAIFLERTGCDYLRYAYAAGTSLCAGAPHVLERALMFLLPEWQSPLLTKPGAAVPTRRAKMRSFH